MQIFGWGDIQTSLIQTLNKRLFSSFLDKWLWFFPSVNLCRSIFEMNYILENYDKWLMILTSFRHLFLLIKFSFDLKCKIWIKRIQVTYGKCNEPNRKLQPTNKKTMSLDWVIKFQNQRRIESELKWHSFLFLFNQIHTFGVIWIQWP